MHEMFFNQLEKVFRKYEFDVGHKYLIHSSKYESKEDCFIVEAKDDWIDPITKLPKPNRFGSNLFVKCCDNKYILMGDIPLQKRNDGLTRRINSLFDRPECGITEVHSHGPYNHHHYMCYCTQENLFYNIKTIFDILSKDTRDEIYRSEKAKEDREKVKVREKRT